MEIKYKDFTIGFEEFIDFSTMENTCCRRACTFRLAKTYDESSYIIVYSFVDHLTRFFSDKAEAFYIDGINNYNKEEAEKILLDVYKDLLNAYEKNPYDMFNMKAYVENKFSGGPKSIKMR